MNPFIQKLSEFFGVPFSDRDGKDFIFDGETIALWFSEEVTFTKSVRKTYLLEHDLLHELLHWYVAAPNQRKYEEFGLSRGVISGSFVGSQAEILGIIPKPEQNIQEIMVQLISFKLGPAWKLPVESLAFRGIRPKPHFWGYWQRWQEREMIKNFPEEREKAESRINWTEIDSFLTL